MFSNRQGPWCLEVRSHFGGPWHGAVQTLRRWAASRWKTVELVASFRGLKSRVTFHAMLWIAHLQKIAPLLTRGNVALSPITSLTSLGTAPWRAAFYYHNIRSPSRRTCDTYWVVEYRWSVLPNQVLILFHPTSHCLFPVLGLQKQSGWCGLRLRGTRGGFSWSALSDLVPFSVAGWKRFQLFHSWVPTSNKIDLARRNLQTLAEIAIWFVWIIIMAIFLNKKVSFFPQKHGTDIAETYQTMLSVQQMEFLEDLWRPGKWCVLRVFFRQNFRVKLETRFFGKEAGYLVGNSITAIAMSPE